MFNLTKNDKRNITRYVMLNYPCLLSDLIREFCFSDKGPQLQPDKVIHYLVWAEKNKKIIVNPSFSTISTMSEYHTIDDIVLKRFDVTISLPDFFVKIFNNWHNKNIS
jgi:hypothetical protein